MAQLLSFYCENGWAEFFLIDLDGKLQYHGTYKFFWKKSKTSHPNLVSHIKNYILWNHEQIY